MTQMKVNHRTRMVLERANNYLRVCSMSIKTTSLTDIDLLKIDDLSKDLKHSNSLLTSSIN